MNPYTGSVDTEENWKADFESMSPETWIGCGDCLNDMPSCEVNEDGTIYLGPRDHIDMPHLSGKTLSGKFDGKWADGTPITFEDGALIEVVPDDEGGWKTAE